MDTKNPYGPTLTARLPQDTVAHELALSGKKHKSTFVSGKLPVSQDMNDRGGIKHRSSSPPLAE